MNTNVRIAVREALDLVSCGYSPSDAIAMALANGQITDRRRWSDAEREQLEVAVWRADNR